MNATARQYAHIWTLTTTITVALSLLWGCIRPSRAGSDLGALDDKALFEAASLLSRDAQTADSAIICFAVLADRLADEPGGKDGMKLYAKTLTNLGYLFSNFRFDYQKAYSFLSEAQEICRREGLDSIEPYIFLNMAVVIEAYGSLRPEHSATDSIAVQYLRDAMDRAAALKQWRAYRFALLNLLAIYTADTDSAATADLLRRHAGASPGQSAQPDFIGRITGNLRIWTGGDARLAAERLLADADTPQTGELQNNELRYSVMGMSADMYDAAGMPARADSVLYACADDIAVSGGPESRMWIAERLVARLQARGDSAAADRWRLRQYEAKDEIYAQTAITRPDGLEFQYRMESVQREAGRERLHRQRMTVLAVVISLIFAIALAAMSAYARHIYKRRRQIQRLYQEAVAEIESRRQSGAKDVDETLMHRVRDIIEHSPSVLSADFSLATLAREAGSNTSYVSHALNSLGGESLPALVARRRIDEACMMLRQRSCDRLTVEAIAEKVGIKSRSNFSALFKRITGLTPSEFRQASRNMPSDGADAPSGGC